MAAATKLKTVYVDDTALLNDTIKEHEDVITKGGRLFVLCTGQYGDDGVSWCGDCNVAKQPIKNALNECAKEYETVLIEARIPRAGYKGNPQHPYRLHPMLSLKGIPTLYLWSGQGRRPTLVLEDEQCADDELLEEMWQ